MDEGRPNSRLDVKGSAKATNFDATVELAGVPTLWRQADLKITASLKSYDAVGVARQIGIEEGEVAVDGGAQFRLTAKGVPDKGLASEVTGSFGGLTLKAAGDAVALAGEPPKFTGTFGVETADLTPLVSLVGLDIPGTGAGLPVSVSGNLAALGTTADIDWQNGAIAGRQVSGKLKVAEGAEGGLRLENGELQLDQLDLGWVASLGLGSAPLPTGTRRSRGRARLTASRRSTDSPPISTSPPSGYSSVTRSRCSTASSGSASRPTASTST